jgi:uncharacterized membrane protein YsdA (DUF1294 family)/cold shock CspA family protein
MPPQTSNIDVSTRASTMRFDGTIKSWNDERGYGFIEPRLGGQDIFVHIKSLPAGTGRPTVGLWVSFEVETNTDGKKRAKSVQFAPQSKAMKARRSEAPAPWTPARTLALPGFAILYWYVATRWSFRPQVALAYAGVSAVAFVAYAIDKSAAVHGRWRTPESTLHLLGLACGWPGALLAQQVLRHKTSKPSFVAAYWATVVANVGGFVAAHSPFATSLLG